MTETSRPLPRWRWILALALALALLSLTSCLTQSVASQCEAVAEEQCRACFACAAEDGEATGADICALIDATTEDACVSEVQTQCTQQARLVRDPYADLDDCESALNRVDCSSRFEWYALDQPRSPASCNVFMY